MEVSKTPFRPSLPGLPDDANQLIIDLMEECWKEDPKERYDIKQAREFLNQMNRGRSARMLLSTPPEKFLWWILHSKVSVCLSGLIYLKNSVFQKFKIVHTFEMYNDDE